MTDQAKRTLHASWVNGSDDGGFYFWVELDKARAGSSPIFDSRYPKYPLAATAATLSKYFDQWLGLYGYYALPTWAYLPRPGSNQQEGFCLPTIQASNYEMIDILLGSHDDLLGQEFAAGADLAYWAAALRFALEIVVGGYYLPTLYLRGKQWQARWEADLDHPTVGPRFDILVEAMPPATLLYAYGERGLAKMIDGEQQQPAPILAGFLNSVVSETLSSFLKRDLAPQSKDKYANLWVQSLFGRHSYLMDDLETLRTKAQRDRLQPLFDSYTAWRGQLTGVAAPLESGSNYRVALRLEQPPSQQPADGLLDEELFAPEQPDKWRLRFLLQANDDPSLLVPAEDVWQADSSSLDYLSRRFDRPHERLLIALGHVARLFPPVERALTTARPTVAYLTLEEAYQFLSEAAPALEENGLGVIVPNWWQQRAKLKAKARLKGADEKKTGSGLFNVEGLVEYDWQLSLGDETFSPDEFAQVADLKQPLVQVRGQWLELRPEQREAALQFLKRNPHGTMALGDAVRLALGGTGEQAAGLEIGEVETQGWLKVLMGELEEGRLEELPPPINLHATLRAYQVRGYSWLAFLRRYGLGACLADDMGLGKTIQLLTLLLREKEAGRAGPSLLLCPTSVVGNWQREADRFTPDLRVMVHHGATRQRDNEHFAADAHSHDLVISSYGLAARDEELFGSVPWRSLVLDEAQNIKNPATRQTRAIKNLPAVQRIALTGTPVENRLIELWSIMDFLNPGYLGSAESFRKHFATPIEKEADPAATQKLRKLTQPFILRRLKTDSRIIQDLPPKNEMKVYCNLSVEQASLYQAFVNDILRQIEESEGIQRRGLVLKMLLRLKQLCNHPAQFLGDSSALAGRSGKLARLEEMLEEALSAGDKVLIFSQFAEMGGMLQSYLQERLGVEALYLSGSTERRKREEMVQRFQSADGPPLFILSLKAGGVGLNLTAANHVFHFDRWWNPAVENQATDRAFRIGQTKSVQVHKFICIGTLEERIDLLIESKRTLAESVIGGDSEGWLTELSTADLRDLVRLSADAVGD